MTASPPIHPLPPDLVDRYKAWRADGFERNRELFKDLVENGQHPHSMVISCCDSRVQPTSIFGAEGGELFVHRNIANLVPPPDGDGLHHGTAAALEYAVTALKVGRIIVMGHSGCGGIENGYHVCNQTPGHPLEETASIYKWLKILGPACGDLQDGGSDKERIARLEKQSVVTSLGNLAGYPFIAEALAAGGLTLHGLWHDIGSGALASYDPGSGEFKSLAG